MSVNKLFNKCTSSVFFISILIMVLSSQIESRAASNSIPHLRKQGTATQLIVDGNPFLILGGELHNSSSSSIEYMKPIWPELARMNLNTVLTTVSWELIEPEEGIFDFTLVDGLIRDAGKNDLHLIFLWFGSWKNTCSSYVPGWVKADIDRFPRVMRSSGEGTERLTPLSETNRDADPGESPLAMCYGVLEQLAPLITKYNGTDTMTGVLLEENDNEAHIPMGDYVVDCFKSSRGSLLPGANAPGPLAAWAQQNSQQVQQTQGLSTQSGARGTLGVRGGAGTRSTPGSFGSGGSRRRCHYFACA